MSWSDIPTCAESGIPIEQYKMPRTVWTSPGVPEEATAYYADLMQKVYETPEWKEYLVNTSQTGTFLAGDALRSFIQTDEARMMQVIEAEAGPSTEPPRWTARMVFVRAVLPSALEDPS